MDWKCRTGPSIQPIQYSQLLQPFEQVLCPAQQRLPTSRRLSVPVAVHHSHSRVSCELFTMAMDEMPVQGVERAGVLFGAVGHLVVAVGAVVRHALDVFAAGG